MNPITRYQARKDELEALKAELTNRKGDLGPIAQRLLEAAGDLLHTGPTGTNVGDILIAIKQPSLSLRGQPVPRML